MTISDVIDIARKNRCEVFVDGTKYESVVERESVAKSHGIVERENFVEFWEIRDRYNDYEPADLSFPADAPVRIVEGCAVVTGKDGNDYPIELYQLAKFPIL
jgi:hypothetical protein